MKILVTGVAGFVGSNLVEYLLEKGHEVVGIDNFSSYYSPAVKEYNIREFKDNPNFKLYREDIVDADKMDEIFASERPEAVCHLAAWAGVTYSIENPVVYAQVNVEGTINIAEASIKNGVKNLIYTSTSSVYGSNPVPFVETMPIADPKSPYPVTKYAAEMLLNTYSMNHGLPVTVVRIFNPIGKRIRPDIATSKLIRSCEYGTEFPIYQDLDSTGRDYCYLGHMLDAIDHILHNPNSYEVYNLGNSSPVTLRGLIEAAETVTGKKVNGKKMPERQGEMVMTYANVDKAKKDLGYNPTYTIEESIKVFYDWYMQQTEEYKKGEL